MTNTDIHRYRVAIMDTDPRCGRSKPLKTFVNCADAIAYAKEACKKHSNVYVEDRIYVCQENLEKDFPLVSQIIAADWLWGVYALNSDTNNN